MLQQDLMSIEALFLAADKSPIRSSKSLSQFVPRKLFYLQLLNSFLEKIKPAPLMSFLPVIYQDVAESLCGLIPEVDTCSG